MYQPTTTPTRACDKDTPLRASSTLTFEGRDDKYGYGKMVEGSVQVWTLDDDFGTGNHESELQYMTLANRLRVKATLFGKYYGRTFRVSTSRNVHGWLCGVTVTRID